MTITESRLSGPALLSLDLAALKKQLWHGKHILNIGLVYCSKPKTTAFKQTLDMDSIRELVQTLDNHYTRTKFRSFHASRQAINTYIVKRIIPALKWWACSNICSLLRFLLFSSYRQAHARGKRHKDVAFQLSKRIGEWWLFWIREFFQNYFSHHSKTNLWLRWWSDGVRFGATRTSYIITKRPALLIYHTRKRWVETTPVCRTSRSSIARPRGSWISLLLQSLSPTQKPLPQSLSKQKFGSSKEQGKKNLTPLQAVLKTL